MPEPSTALASLYKQFQSANQASAFVGKAFYRPVLVRPPKSWRQSTHRIAYVGQEPWDAPGGEREMLHLSDFFRESDAVGRLMATYDSVASTLAREDAPTGCFWRYFRRAYDEVSATGVTSAVWTNLVHCAMDNGKASCSIHRAAPPVRDAYLNWQHGLLTRELEILAPTLVVFVTGPRYDHLLEREYPGLVMRKVSSDFSLRQLARIEHPRLPHRSYRTYHPSFLNREKSLQFGPISRILSDESKEPGANISMHLSTLAHLSNERDPNGIVADVVKESFNRLIRPGLPVSYEMSADGTGCARIDFGDRGVIKLRTRFQEKRGADVRMECVCAHEIGGGIRASDAPNLPASEDKLIYQFDMHVLETMRATCARWHGGGFAASAALMEEALFLQPPC
jgi:hypothetical protein